MNIYQKLSDIQSRIKVNKSNYNSFGKYSYRSAEDILEASKPICKDAGCVLTLSDDIVSLDGRFYVKANATLTDIESLETIQVSALAREEEAKKGMDGSQVTGTASSYARKYALNGLFNLDDAKDADTDEYTAMQKKRPQKAETAVKMPQRTITPEEELMLEQLIVAFPAEDPVSDRIKKICTANHVESLGDLTKTQYDNLLKQLGGNK